MKRDHFISLVVFETNTDLDDLSYLKQLGQRVSELYDDYEIIVVLNELKLGQTDIQKITQDLQFTRVIRLAYPIEVDDAYSVGLELATGDSVVILNPQRDSIDSVMGIIDEFQTSECLVLGVDNSQHESSFYKLFKKLFLSIPSKGRYSLPTNLTGLVVVPRTLLNSLDDKVSDINDIHKIFNKAVGFETYDYQVSRSKKKKLFKALGVGIKFIIFQFMPYLQNIAILGLLVGLVFVVYSAINTQFAQVLLASLLTIVFFVVAILSEYIQRILQSLRPQKKFRVEKEYFSNIIINTDRLNIIEND